MTKYDSENHVLNYLVNWLPPAQAGRPIDYLKSVLGNNYGRALKSLGRAHGMVVEDTVESNAELAFRLESEACKSIEEIIELLAEVARQLDEEGGWWLVHGYSPEVPLLESLEASQGC